MVLNTLYKLQQMNRAGMKRLPREIESVADLSGQGIYYVADSDNVFKGHALIIGDADSAYPFVMFFFRLIFPPDYPFSPPAVTFLSSDGLTRFHPNLYIGGKVCLSILGTFTGPSWMSTMSLQMILLSLKALLDNNPITHEPGWEKLTLTDTRALHYSQYVRAKSVELTFYEFKKRKFLHLFEEDIPHILPGLQSSLKNLILKESQFADTHYAHLPYSMIGSTRWKALAQEVLAAQ